MDESKLRKLDLAALFAMAVVTLAPLFPFAISGLID
jgi:hypothetical protein